MTIDNYKGLTREALKRRFIYDPLEGTFYNKKSGKPIDSTMGGRLVLPIRVGDKTLSLSPARVAVAIVDNKFLCSDQRIKFLDGDNLNFVYSNLSIISTKDATKDIVHTSVNYKAVDTEVDGVVLLKPMNYFVVRRGPTQAVYRTYSFEEAVAVRKEWEKDKTLHRWDSTIPKKFLLDLEENP